MIYFSPDGNSAVLHDSCGDDGHSLPHLTLRYGGPYETLQGGISPPDLLLYAHGGNGRPYLWRRLCNAFRALRGRETEWPEVMCLLGGNERETEVLCVRRLAEWLNEKAGQYEKDLADQATRIREGAS